MKYDEDTLNEINENADLIAYVSDRLDLEKRGEDFYAHCPLHVDETPSLSFSPQKNFYYCFSCGRKGRMIRWLMDYEGMDFEAAVQKAASVANMDLSKVCRSETMAFLKRYRDGKRAKREKKKYVHDLLPVSAIEKFSKEPIKLWLKEGISQETMNLFGVRIDPYANRIVYPVYDSNGNLINVKGRTQYENYKSMRLAKYINYYKVGVMDYFQGMHITLPYIKEKSEVIIFESIKSVMKIFDWGYKNSVSAETHSITNEQIEILIRLRSDVVFAFDSDVNYTDETVKNVLDKLRRFTNVYIIDDPQSLLGGRESKNAPADCGREVWETLYAQKRKVV